MVITYVSSNLPGKFEHDQNEDYGLETVTTNEKDHKILYPFFKFKKYHEIEESEANEKDNRTEESEERKDYVDTKEVA